MNYNTTNVYNVARIGSLISPFEVRKRLDYKKIVDNLMGLPLPPEIRTPEVVTTIVIDNVIYADEKKFDSNSLLYTESGQIYEYNSGLNPFTIRGFDFTSNKNPFRGKDPIVSLRHAIRHAVNEGVSIEKMTEIFHLENISVIHDEED